MQKTLQHSSSSSRAKIHSFSVVAFYFYPDDELNSLEMFLVAALISMDWQGATTIKDKQMSVSWHLLGKIFSQNAATRGEPGNTLEVTDTADADPRSS